jgi:hypothetical protein
MAEMVLCAEDLGVDWHAPTPAHSMLWMPRKSLGPGLRRDDEAQGSAIGPCMRSCGRGRAAPDFARIGMDNEAWPPRGEQAPRRATNRRVLLDEKHIPVLLSSPFPLGRSMQRLPFYAPPTEYSIRRLPEAPATVSANARENRPLPILPKPLWSGVTAVLFRRLPRPQTKPNDGGICCETVKDLVRPWRAL